MGVIPKAYEKHVFWGVAIVGGLVLLNVWNKGVKGATADIVGGVIGGAFDVTAGILQGSYNALPEVVKPSSDKNIVYKSVNKVGEVFTGNAEFDLGVWIYDATH